MAAAKPSREETAEAWRKYMLERSRIVAKYSPGYVPACRPEGPEVPRRKLTTKQLARLKAMKGQPKG